MIFFINAGNRSNNIIAKLTPGTPTQEALQTLENLYKKYDPINPFEYEFVDHDHAEKFGDEERIGNLAGIFTILAIIISCMGLSGMISFVIQQRTKEIGIRKVLGSSNFGIMQLLSKDFTKTVVIAIAIALPMSYLIASRWLENFAFKITLHWGIFVGTGLLVLLIAWLTIGLQTFQAARVNPIQSLKQD